MKKLVEMQEVTAGYNNSVVLNKISLSIYENDFLGIIGPNGCGKTTLLKVILGLLKQQKGTVQFSKELFQSGKKRSRKKIGYLPQFKNIDLQFPIQVKDVVRSGLLSNGGINRFTAEEKKKIDAILDRFGISHLKENPIGELSGGQMQRVFLSRALISSPRLLILDEPDTFIDRSFSLDLNDILKELNREMAILLVSHDIGSIISSVKNIACVNGALHYHSVDEVSYELLEDYQCGFRLLGHGDIPHTVLKKHGCGE
ncbi:MAG: ABC transporter ATP-binding protein [bacterium]|nr:ABC transporter ATP-binding protein [bacterium]